MYDDKLPPPPIETQWAPGFTPVPRSRSREVLDAVGSFLGGSAKFVAVGFLLIVFIAGLKSLGIDLSGMGGQ